MSPPCFTCNDLDTFFDSALTKDVLSTMTSALICVCNYNTRNCRALAKHKQCCEVARAHIRSNFNVLLSTSNHSGGVANDDDCNDDVANNAVYEFHDYNASNEYKDVTDDTICASDCSSSCSEDDHSATISLCSSMDVVNIFHNDQTSEDDTVDANSNHSMSCEYQTSTSPSTANSDENEHTSIAVKYYPPMFSNDHRRLCFSSAYQLQVQLNSLLNQNRASVGMYNEVINLFNAYLTLPEFSRMTTLKSRNKFLLETEKAFLIETMKPMYGRVKLRDNSLATVPVFDATTMILSLLHDPTLMVPENFALGYDIFTGAELEGCHCNGRYGEVHTGNAWAKALRWHCGSDA